MPSSRLSGINEPVESPGGAENARERHFNSCTIDRNAPHKSISAVDIWQKHQCVYGWRRGKEYLYIGLSSLGISRVITHNIIGRAEPVRQEDFGVASPNE